MIDRPTQKVVRDFEIKCIKEKIVTKLSFYQFFTHKFIKFFNKNIL